MAARLACPPCRLDAARAIMAGPHDAAAMLGVMEDLVSSGALAKPGLRAASKAGRKYADASVAQWMALASHVERVARLLEALLLPLTAEPGQYCLACGRSDEPGDADGTLSEARLQCPRAVASFDDGSLSGVLFVLDGGLEKGRLRKLTRDGCTWQIQTIRNVPALSYPRGLALTRHGDIFVTDEAGHVHVLSMLSARRRKHIEALQRLLLPCIPSLVGVPRLICFPLSCCGREQNSDVAKRSSS